MSSWLDLMIHPVMDPKVAYPDYCLLDLSVDNKELQDVNVGDANELGNYINQVIARNQATFAMGGYLEKRGIYARSAYFKPPTSTRDERNIHLGLDIWGDAGTSVHAVMDGVVHSFANNTNHGDYGPTIILEHQSQEQTIYSLYGHLSLESIDQLQLGQEVQGGQQIATLGTAKVNGDYPPHLHFQLIKNIGEYRGDYPGVCSLKELDFYSNNCPNPIFFLGIM